MGLKDLVMLSTGESVAAPALVPQAGKEAGEGATASEPCPQGGQQAASEGEAESGQGSSQDRQQSRGLRA